jgi:hypothetical protein
MRSTTLLLLTCLLGVNVEAQFHPSPDGRSCPVSPLVLDAAPSSPHADPVGSRHPQRWYINEDRTIWAGPVPFGGWTADGGLYQGNPMFVKGQKTYWVRPPGTQLMITGHRLDGIAPLVEAHIPCCYTSSFQIVGLHFPTEGCWEVVATSGVSELRFITQVRLPDEAREK